MAQQEPKKPAGGVELELDFQRTPARPTHGRKATPGPMPAIKAPSGAFDDALADEDKPAQGAFELDAPQELVARMDRSQRPAEAPAPSALGGSSPFGPSGAVPEPPSSVRGAGTLVSPGAPAPPGSQGSREPPPGTVVSPGAPAPPAAPTPVSSAPTSAPLASPSAPVAGLGQHEPGQGPSAGAPLGAVEAHGPQGFLQGPAPGIVAPPGNFDLAVRPLRDRGQAWQPPSASQAFMLRVKRPLMLVGGACALALFDVLYGRSSGAPLGLKWIAGPLLVVGVGLVAWELVRDTKR